MGDNYYQNPTMYGGDGRHVDNPQGPHQGRLPPLSGQMQEDVQLNNMNNKVGVDNQSFVSDPPEKHTPNGMDNGRGSHGDPESPDPGESEPTHEKQKPLRFCSFVVNNHKLAFGITLGGQIMMFVITAILIAAGYDVFPLEFEGVPLYITDDDTYLRWLAWEYRDESPDIIKANTSSVFVGTRTDNNDILQLFYDAGDNLLTKERLQAINATEMRMTGDQVPKWQQYCKVISKDNQVCSPPMSIIRYFDAVGNFDDIPGVLNAVNNDPDQVDNLKGLLGRGYRITANEAYATLTRSLFFFGVPLDGQDLSTDSLDDQEEEIRDFQVDEWRGIVRDLNDDGLSGMSVYYTARELQLYDTFKQVVFDLALAGGSILFIFFFMLFQTNSLWLTGWALFSILGSFMGCNLIYRIVLDYKYFGIFHVLSVFIILGIGADDIFVFNDTWRATALEGHENLADRLSAAYRRASMSMLITTLTTFVAFVTNALSPLLGISAFGIFSAVMVFVNYLSAIIFFPCVVIMYHHHFADWTWPCCKPIDALIDKITSACKKGDDDGEDKPNIVVRFFDGPYASAVTHKWYRWIFIAVSTICVIIFVYFCSTLEVDEKEMQFYRDGHNYQKASVLNRDEFEESLDDKNVEVYLMFGLENQDRDDCHKTEFDCEGTTVWDNSFDLNPKPAQAELLKLCDYIKNMDTSKHTDLRLKRLPNGQVEMECFIENMDIYMTNQSHDSTVNNVTTTHSFELPVSEIKYQYFFDDHQYLYNQTLIYGENFYRYFETVKSYWLQNGYAGDTTDDYRVYSVKLGEGADAYDTAYINGTTGVDAQLYGTRLRYAGIMFKTTLIQGTLTYNDGLDWMDAWNAFIASEMSKLPPSLAGGVPMTPGNDFHDFKVKETLARSAIQSILIGLWLSFVVLTIATTNIILSALATANIACVVVTVTGLMPVMGWKLSVIESVNLSLVVGLAVDYVVHLSESYSHSPSMDRKVKVRHMLKSMGVSVISGACSTCGASSFMMAAVLQFFLQFGIFVFCTIAFSLFYSLCLFTPILGMIGPVGTTGSLKPLVRRLVYKIKGRRMTDPDCDECKGKGFIKERDNTDL